MVRYENECCDCAVPGYPCRGSSCPLRHVKVYSCDCCGADINTDYDSLYILDGEELCKDCVLEKLEKVEFD